MRHLSILFVFLLLSCNEDKIKLNIVGEWLVTHSNKTYHWTFTGDEVKIYDSNCKLLSEGEYYLDGNEFYRTAWIGDYFYFDGEFQGRLELIRPNGDVWEFERKVFRCFR